jgi:hypothetical protein
MRKTVLICSLLLFTAAFGLRAIAQDEPKPPETAQASTAPGHFYHLEFVVQELGTDGKPLNSRTYTTTTSTDARNNASIRTSSRIPVATGSYQAGPDTTSALVNTQYQYMNVGVDIDVHHTREIGRQLSFDLVADISSLAESRDAKLRQPVIRQNRWQAAVLIPIGKPTVVFTSDALDSKGSMQLVVSATPVQ